MRRLAILIVICSACLTAGAGLRAEDVRGLTGRYYDNFSYPDSIITFSDADLVFTRVDTLIQFWNPIDCYYCWEPVGGAGNWYGVRWQGHLRIDVAGDYGFGTISDDGSQLWLDGDLIVNNGEEQWWDWEDCLFEGSYTGLYPEGCGQADTLCGPITLSEGRHAIELRFYEARNFDGIELWWLPPGSGPSDIPYYGPNCSSYVSANPQTNWEIIPADHLLPGPTPVPLDAPPAAAVLHPAQPNPFNPCTRLAFTLPESGKVDLAVYSIAGRRLATVFRGRADAGRTEFTWRAVNAHGRTLPSGVYLVSLNTERAALARRVTLLK